MYFLLKMGIFHCYVSLLEGTRLLKEPCQNITSIIISLFISDIMSQEILFFGFRMLFLRYIGIRIRRKFQQTPGTSWNAPPEYEDMKGFRDHEQVGARVWGMFLRHVGAFHNMSTII